jgi:neutral ceramidase
MPRTHAALVGLVWLMTGCASAPVTRDTPASPLIPVGVSEIDITPTEPIRLTGYGSRTAPSEGIGQRLTASALAFGDDTSPTVLITADLIGVPRRLTEDIARRLYRGVRGPGSTSNARVPRAHFAISTTHTHTGPSLPGVLPFIFTSPLDDDQRAVIDRYGRDLADRFERVARSALEERRPARVAWTAGRATFAANRRVLKDGKWTGFGITANGAVDHDLPILTVRSPEGALRAVLVNYACHATTLEGKANVVHGDWPGVAKELIQKRHPGTIALVAIGTGADANPNPRGGGVPHVEQHAETIANEVDRLLATTLQPVTAAPIGRLQYIDLAFARLPSRQEWEAQASKAHPAGFLARDVLQRLERGESVSTSVPYPVQTWTFGDRLAMVFLGGEVVADYGLRLKRDLDGSRLWVNAYSNDVSFYVASRRMIPEGGYEVDASMVYYGQPSRLADDTEDRIVRAVRKLLPSTFKRTTPRVAHGDSRDRWTRSIAH